MSTTCGRSQEGRGGPAYVAGEGESKPDFFVDVIIGWSQGYEQY